MGTQTGLERLRCGAPSNEPATLAQRIEWQRSASGSHTGPSGELIAEGPVGWAIAPFEGNWYIGAKHLRTNGLRTTALPGLCFYKFLYLWVDFHAADGSVSKHLAWKYVIPNPLFPFIMFRVAVPGHHPDVQIEVTQAELS